MHINSVTVHMLLLLVEKGIDTLHCRQEGERHMFFDNDETNSYDRESKTSDNVVLYIVCFREGFLAVFMQQL